jgi:two-component system CitB family sensor kinase
VESVREGIIAINKIGKIITFNQNAAKMIGLARDRNLTGAHIDDVLPESNLKQVLESGVPEYDQSIIINNREFVANRIPIRQDNQITGVVASFRKKDELESLSLELNQSKQHIDSLRSQAHEYSNKLHTISGLIQIDAKEEALEIIGQEINEHQNLLELLFHQVPDPLISGLLIGKYNRAKELAIRLEIDPESSLHDFPEHISRNAVVSILGNIIDNAFEAVSEQNPPQKTVKLVIFDSGKDIIFEVEDNGVGIATEVLDKVFQKGYTTKQSNNTQPRGYGLHLSQELISKLNGEITFAQIQLSGTRVTVYIPKDPKNRSL